MHGNRTKGPIISFLNVIQFVYLYLTLYFVNYFSHLQYTKADLLDCDLFGFILCILVYYNLLHTLNFLKLKESIYFTYVMLQGLTMCITSSVYLMDREQAKRHQISKLVKVIFLNDS